MTVTLVIFFATIVLFLVGKIRSDIVALCSMAALLATGVLTPSEALAGFSNSAVIMMVGLFVVGGAVFQTGLARTISGRLLRLAGTSQKKLFFLVVLVTACVAAFVSNTGTVALLLPIVLAMAKTSGTHPGMLMMPLAFASSMGGIITLIGTPPNLIVDGYLREHGFGGFGFFEFTPIGLVCLAVGLLLLYPLCRFFLGRRKKSDDQASDDDKSLDELLHEYRVDELVHRVRVGSGSRLAGRSVGELDIHHACGITLLEVRRGHKSLASTLLSSPIQERVGPETVLDADDLIYLLGHEDAVRSFCKRYDVTYLPDSDEEGRGKLDYYEIGLSEMVLTPGSALVGRTVAAANLRERFGLNILAVKHGSRYITEGVERQRLSAGDMMLVHGPWTGIESLGKKRREWLVIGNPAEAEEQAPLNHKAPLAAAIMVAMVLVMVFADQLGVEPSAAVIVAGLLIVLTRCVRSVDDAYKMIGWESIVLIAAMMPMSTALEKTGISAAIANGLVDTFHGYGPIAALAGVYLVTSLLSTFISNSATAILVAPIAMQTAVQMGVDPAPFMMTAAVAASACFAAPISTPPNAMVMSAGRYTFMDYVKVGVPLQVAIGIVAVLVIPLFFPFG